MKQQLATQKRILKVRETLRRVAIGRAMDAQSELETLEIRSSQLVELRKAIFNNLDCGEGQSLAARMELGHRLVGADDQMSLAVTNARQAVADKDRQRVAAHVERDAMRHLVQRKAAAMAKLKDQKIAANLPLRRPNNQGQTR